MPPRGVAFAVALIALAGLVLVGARDIAPPVYDSLGSAAMPVVVAGLIAFLALVNIAQLALERRRLAVAGGDDGESPGRLLAAALFALMTVAYVGAMSAGLLGFQWATAAYAIGSVLLLAGFRRSALLPALALAAVAAFGGYRFFTQFFFVALP